MSEIKFHTHEKIQEKLQYILKHICETNFQYVKDDTAHTDTFSGEVYV
jgi:hypothetical protein